MIGIAVTACLAAVAASLITVRLTAPGAAAIGTDHVPATPLANAIDAFGCKKGLNRIVLMRGVEDGFSLAGDEPAQIDRRLLRNGHFADLAEGGTNAQRLRNYDEGGSDKILVDHFILPPGITSGKLVMRITKSSAGADNDGVLIGDLDELSHPADISSWGKFNFRIEGLWRTSGLQSLTDGSAIVTIDFADLPSTARDPQRRTSFADYVNQGDRSPDIDLKISDDTKVDALALLACQLPAEAKGVTFVENRTRLVGDSISWLSCAMDVTQRGCDPFAGDRLCSAAGPLACYREGSRQAPAEIRTVSINPGAFVGGEVRLTKPVRGDQFAHLGDANAFCQAQFGREWRVLSYHEGGGGQVISYSRIPPGSRALVNIRDQQHANCWDRDLKR